VDARSTVERYVEAYVTGDVSRLGEIVADDCVNHSIPAYTGREGVARAIAGFHAGFSEIEVSLEHCVCDGEWVAFRVVAGATHTGAFAGRAATGRRIVFTAADFVRLRDGKFAELWTIQDPPSIAALLD
jgi:predicted ester cyclase